MPKINLNEKTIKSIPDCSPSQFYGDENLTGFGVFVQGKSRSYLVRGRCNGRQVNVTLGKVEKFKSVKDARDEAKDKLEDLRRGINPVAEKRKKQVEGITLGEVFISYLADRKNLKASTLNSYQELMRTDLKDPKKPTLGKWAKEPLKNIDGSMVKTLHKQITEARGPAPANGSMKLLRALWNYASDEWPAVIPPLNPCDKLTKTRAWNKLKPRESYIRQTDLPAFYRAVVELEGIGRDVLLFLFYTGLRRGEALGLLWENVDFAARTMTFIDTKNRKTLTLPMSTAVEQILRARHDLKESDFVFPGEGKTGHFQDIRKQLGQVEKKTGIDITPHDLRRTLATYANAVAPGYSVKAMLNHSTGGDITAAYIQTNVDTLRAPVQAVADHLILLCTAWSPWPRGTTPTKTPKKVDNVIELKTYKKAA